MYHQYYYQPYYPASPPSHHIEHASDYYAMPAEHSLSLARQPSQVHLSKATRQVVPAFLQKLFEMVNDPSNADLIRWSDAGDSFFVLDHERFARQVLGRWFKHQNFSSFVRQLNMYGFHKIPHLQQGVLRSDQEAEFWNFEHPNFHRGQPDLLCLIQRKKQAPQSSDLPSDPDPAASASANPSSSSHTQSPADPSASSAPATAALGNGQVLDIHSIINGIAAIKRHQTTISAELNQLKRSNQLLWQESLAARQRHQKHQDTINRILKFLAGVFGNGGGHAKDGVVAGGAEGAMGMGLNGSMGMGMSGAMGMAGAGGDAGRNEGYQRKQVQRLMIEEGPNSGKRKMPVVQVEEEDDDDEDASYLRDMSPVSLRSYNEPMSPTISEAPYINLNTPSLTPPRDTSTTPQIMQPKPSPSRGLPTANSLAAALSPALSLSSSTASNNTNNGNTTNSTNGNGTSNTNNNNNANNANSNTNSSGALTTLSPSPPLPVLNGVNGDQDTMIQALQQMLTSPGQIQRLFAALSAHNNNNASGSGVGGCSSNIRKGRGRVYKGNKGKGSKAKEGTGRRTGLSLLTPSPPPLLSPLSHPLSSMNANINMGISPLDMQSRATREEEREQQQRLEKTWKVTQDIDKDVNALHSSIESLIGAFGLDPGLMGANSANSAAGGMGSSNGVSGNGNGMGDMNGVGGQGVGQGVGGMGVGGVGVGGVGGMEDLSVPEFDFDAFLNEYGNSGMTGMNGMNGMGGMGGGLGGVGGIGGVGDGDVDMELGNGMNGVHGINGGGVNGVNGGFLDEDGTVMSGSVGGTGSVAGSPVISFANANASNINGSINGSGGVGGDGNGASTKKAKMNGHGHGHGHAHASSISSVSSLSGMQGIEASPSASPSSPALPAKSAPAPAPVSPKATKGRKRKSDAAEIEDMQRGMGGSALGALGALGGLAGAGAGAGAGATGAAAAGGLGNGVSGGVGTASANGNAGGGVGAAGGGTGKRKR
ncbi:Heat shock transcription factor [Pleurotus ostreatus]|nr:Heat shock transcription factor [Pleurotus ostreatus]